MTTRRLADPETAAGYPLAITAAADWSCVADGCILVVPVPPLPAGTLLVPSLSLAVGTEPDQPAPRHRWTLSIGDDDYPLPPVPSNPPDAAGAADPDTERGRAVNTHIDCFRIHRDLPAGELVVRLESGAPPLRYLVSVSARPFTVAAPPLPDHRAAAPAPPPRSQMTAPAGIAPRICSPTCVSMVLDGWRRPHDWLGLVGECFDPGTGMYGVWPMALRAAAAHGCLGAVEVFDRWEEPLTVLAQGVPLITSIRFANGALPGAPLNESGGHLVALYAAGPDEVEVCDPAAVDGEVRRRYPADAFSQAWLRHRGAAYILPP